MTMFRRRLARSTLPLLAGGVVLVAALGVARADGDCVGHAPLSEGAPIAIGRIAPAEPRSFFFKNGSEAKGCPNTTAACRAKAFVVPGDQVIVSQSQDGFICADYVGAKGSNRPGWLAAASVVPEDAKPVTLADWTGTWTQTEATITFKPGGRAGDLAIHGDATYGSLDPERVKRGGVNIGEIAGTMAPKGNALAFAMGEKATLAVDKGQDSDCKVWMRRVGPFLLVEDNNQCGGFNVSFVGIYRRKA